jgi:hypothetical protein
MDIIYTENLMLLSKEKKEWKEWQDIFNDYKASLSIDSIHDLISFLEDEYRLNPINLESFINQIQNSTSNFLQVEFEKGNIFLADWKDNVD